MSYDKKTKNTAVGRTAIQNAIGIVVVFITTLIVLQESGKLDEVAELLPSNLSIWLSGIGLVCVTISSVITRLMYVPEMERLIEKYAPALSYLNRPEEDEEGSDSDSYEVDDISPDEDKPLG